MGWQGSVAETMTHVPPQSAPALSLKLIDSGTADVLKLGTGIGGRFSLIVFYRGAGSAGMESPDPAVTWLNREVIS
jgi:hypothetical protein